MAQDYEAPEYLVEGLLEQDTEATLIGPSKSFKSYFALELAACVATGTPFRPPGEARRCALPLGRRRRYALPAPSADQGARLWPRGTSGAVPQAPRHGERCGC